MNDDPLAAALRCRLTELANTVSELVQQCDDAPVMPAARLLLDLFLFGTGRTPSR